MAERRKYASSSASGRNASRTRPFDVAWAGSRDPTVTASVMRRRVGVRATYRMSVPSRTAIEADSSSRSVSDWRYGFAKPHGSTGPANGLARSRTAGVRLNSRRFDST